MSKKSLKRVVIFGFVAWLIPFIIGVAVFPVKKSNPAFFETIMAVVLVIVGVVFARLYFKKAEEISLRQGIIVGMVWLCMGIVIDLFFFSWGPMQMAPLDYLLDIGLEYLIYPIATASFVLAVRGFKSKPTPKPLPTPPPPSPPQP